MNLTKSNLLIAVLLLFSIVVNAQEKENYTGTMRSMPFQVSLITPIGTNGMDSWNTVNKVSINIWGGYSGGLDGFEIGGYANVLKGDMHGAQFAGFVNADLGVSEGAQFAGFLNYNKLHMKGVQISGFANVVSDDAVAFQGSGFANVVTGSAEGTQLAGFANVAADDSKVVQLSGFANAVRGSVEGFQGSGFANYSEGNTIGQISGYANVNMGDLEGVQLSGFINVNTGRLKGFQGSGFINVSNKLKGTQLGVFNYVDSLESGVSIGVLSIVKNGYRKVQISANESFYANASFKTGTRQFYNILSIAGSARDNKLIWAYGYGVGTTVGINDKMDLNMEGIVYHVNEDKWLYKEVNVLTKLQAVVNWQFSEQASVFGGPSWNVLVSDTKDRDYNDFNSSVPPFTVFDKVYDDNDIKVVMYPGLSVGVRF